MPVGFLERVKWIGTVAVGAIGKGDRSSSRARGSKWNVRPDSCGAPRVDAGGHEGGNEWKARRRERKGKYLLRLSINVHRQVVEADRWLRQSQEGFGGILIRSTE